MAKRSDQPASLDPVGSFQVHYRGRLASEGIVEAESFATSLLGATKLYASLVHYAGTGKILKSNSQRNFRIYTRAAEKGNSVDLELVVLAVLHATNVHAADPTLYNEITEGVKGLARKIRGVFRFRYRHKSPRVVQVQCQQPLAPPRRPLRDDRHCTTDCSVPGSV